MNKAELKVVLETAKKVNASPAATLLAIVDFVFLDEKLSGNELVAKCNINRSTMTRNAQEYREIAQAVKQFAQTPAQSAPSFTLLAHTPVQEAQTPTHSAQKEKESFPPHPLIKNKEKVSSLRSDTTSACGCTHDGTADDEVREGFSSFCRIYPKTPKGAVLIKAGQLWEELLKAGYTAKDIESAVWVSIHSEDWTKENGRYIPRADNFLDRILHPEKETSSGPIKAAPSASEGSGYIQVPLDDHGALGNVAKSSTETRFLKTYGRWYKNQYAFNVAWANAKADVDEELLVYCAEVARDKARERDGDTQYIRLPEEWLRDGRYMDYIKEAEYKKRTSGTNQAFYDAFNV